VASARPGSKEAPESSRGLAFTASAVVGRDEAHCLVVAVRSATPRGAEERPEELPESLNKGGRGGLEKGTSLGRRAFRWEEKARCI
jgi:hypothetical protein